MGQHIPYNALQTKDEGSDVTFAAASFNFTGAGVDASSDLSGAVSVNIPGGGGSGESNTTSNAGLSGVGIVLPKVGVDLPFKSIAGSTYIDVTDNTNNIGLSLNTTALNSVYAPLSHTHTIANVTGLQTALDNKLDDSQASAYGLTLLDDADAGTARSTLGLGSSATQAYTEIADAAISSTITWTGTTAPSGASSLRVSGTQIGKLVIARIRLEYANAGSALTAVTINWPTQLPNPADITGWGNSEVGMVIPGGLATTAGGVHVTTSLARIVKDGSGNFQIVISAASAAYRTAYATLVYSAA